MGIGRIAVALAATGPGRFSLDRAIGWDDNISGVWWGVAALAAATVVSLLTSDVFKDFPTLKILVSHGGGAIPYPAP